MDASLEQAVCLIEWSDRLPQAPTERLDLFFTLLNTAYQVSILASLERDVQYMTCHGTHSSSSLSGQFLPWLIRLAYVLLTCKAGLSAVWKEDWHVLLPFHLSL